MRRIAKTKGVLLQNREQPYKRLGLQGPIAAAYGYDLLDSGVRALGMVYCFAVPQNRSMFGYNEAQS
jgi:hypothetical protein